MQHEAEIRVQPWRGMNELSYSDALAAGIEPIQYRSDVLDELGVGLTRAD